MKRKDFLRVSALSAMGTMVSSQLLGKAFSKSDVVSGSSFEVLIVGTGYGSAVTAERLGASGVKCLMLEMGMDWSKRNVKFSKMAWAEKQSTWLKNTTVAPFGNFRVFSKYTGALDRLDFENVKVYAGRGVGGGSLVNGGMSVMPKREYFEEIFPSLDSDQFYNNFFPKANAGLGVNTIPEDYYNSTPYYQYSRTGEAEAKKAGYKTVRVPNVYDYDYMKKEEAGLVEKSALDGEVIYGNNHGKNDLTKTYLKRALDTGNVSILDLHRVDELVENSDDTFTVVVSEINTSGDTVATKSYNTKKLFLGAGSMGTTKLLLKSQHNGSLTKLNSQVGKLWGNNGNTMCARNYSPASYGNKQSTMPAAGIDAWTKNDDAVFAEIAPLPIGLDFKAAVYLVINRVPNKGSMTYDASSDKLVMNWDSTHNAHMVRNAGAFLDRMNKFNGGKRAWELFSNKGIDPTICYHPLGGCVLGEATDNYGRVKGYKGLYVMDGALVPATIGVNPYVTITALAEHNIEDIIANDFGDGSSDTVEVKPTNLVAFPNPFKSYLDLQFYSPVDGQAKVEIYNWANVRVTNTTFSVSKGQSEYRWSGLSYLWAENYVLKLTIGSQTTSIKIRKSWW